MTEQGRWVAELRRSNASGLHDHEPTRSEQERRALEREQHLATWPEDITAEDIADEVFGAMTGYSLHRVDDPESQGAAWRIVVEAGGRRFAVTVTEEDPDLRN